MNDARDQQDRCVVCGKDVSNVWFARLRRGEEWVKVCSPACSMRYAEGPAADNGGATESTPGERPHFLVNGELWS
jgi:hypothetical protein